MGLRIILGTMRSTPIQQMEKSVDLQPLKCRREYKAATQEEKLKRQTSHPLHKKILHGTKKPPEQADPGKCEELTMSVWAPRKSLPKVRTDILGLAAKGT